MTSSMYIGLLSGTSMDAVDAALVEIHGAQLRCLQTHAQPIDPALQARLRALADPQCALNLDEYGTVDALLGERFAQAALNLLEKAQLEPAAVRAIGSHGQTVRHRPDTDPPFTLQIGNPHRLAQRTGILTVADFRTRDMAVGGQGAPLAPAFHQAFLRSATHSRAVLNIGGIANITVLPHDPQSPVIGFDAGPGNALLDAWIRQHQARPYDADGAWARTGRLLPELLARLLSDPYFARPAPKSTGIESFHLHWLAPHLAGQHYRPEDVQRTLLELSAVSIQQAIQATCPPCAEVLVCGGGVHNGFLLARLQSLLPAQRVHSTAQAGLEPDWIEAMCFAWLAHQHLEGLPGNLPSVTGAREAVILGSCYEGSRPRGG